ncbi:DUF3492 domain-containing protein [Streptomyces sp. NPDC059785]|uniref:DUF3492 domain-containing protein n=1 Tax=unclassified Streptomyces TaxID=2593676 RepID=UPI00365FB6E9
MRIGLLTEGGYPYVSGDARLWCDRLVRGLTRHEFDVYALSRTEQQEREGWIELPPQVTRVRTAPLWTAGDDRALRGRRARRRFAEAYGELVDAVCGRPPGTADGSPLVPGGDAASVAGRAEKCADGAEADRFGTALYALAELARDEGGLAGGLRSEIAVRALERACRVPGALRAARTARVPELLTVADHFARALRPLSLDWYGDDGLASADLCHATAGGAAALPGLLAGHFSGVPLLVTEYGVQLRAHYLASAGAAPATRALLAAFHGELAAEVYRRAAAVTPGNTHARRWQERCGADRAKLRTIYPGMDASRFAEVGERGAGTRGGARAGRTARTGVTASAAGVAGAVGGVGVAGSAGVMGGAGAVGVTGGPGAVGVTGGRDTVGVMGGADSAGGAGCEPDTLVWVGRVEPAKDLVCLLHAFARIRERRPRARLRIVGAAAGAEGVAYLGQCRALAAQLFPDEADGAHAVGDNPVSFEEIGGPEAPDLAEAYAAGAVVVLSSVVEGFPVSLIEAMFCGRATVSTDVGAVVEVIGGTGLVVPPRNPRALAEACLALLSDPERRARLGAAARARALELFTVEQNIAAFHGIYLEVVSRSPVRGVVVDASGEPLPFGTPAESHVPGHWTGVDRRPTATRPRWATDSPPRDAAPVREGAR